MPNKKTSKSKEKLVKGSKIPLSFLIDYIKEGYSLSDFLSSYPWIKKRNVEDSLEEIKKASSNYAF